MLARLLHTKQHNLKQDIVRVVAQVLAATVQPHATQITAVFEILAWSFKYFQKAPNHERLAEQLVTYLKHTLAEGQIPVQA